MENYPDIEVFVIGLMKRISSIMDKFLETIGLSKKQLESLTTTVMYTVLEDFEWMSSNDPASEGVSYSGDVQLSALAIMYYRIANKINYYNGIEESVRQKISRQISEIGKLQTAVEIHPAAKIGRKFCIDHGHSTIIGQTTEIGERCIILNGVILGAKKIESGDNKKRHPTIKNDVVVCAFARIFGPVVIGNNVFVGPFSTVTRDIPDNTEIQVVDQQQITKKRKSDGRESRKSDYKIYGIIPNMDSKRLIIFGKLFHDIKIELVSFYSDLNKEIQIICNLEIENSTNDNVTVRFNETDLKSLKPNLKNYGLKLFNSSGDVILIPYSLSVTDLVKNIQDGREYYE